MQERKSNWLTAMSSKEPTKNYATVEDIKLDGHGFGDSDSKDGATVAYNGMIHGRQRLLSLSVPR